MTEIPSGTQKNLIEYLTNRLKMAESEVEALRGRLDTYDRVLRIIHESLRPMAVAWEGVNRLRHPDDYDTTIEEFLEEPEEEEVDGDA